MTDTVKLADLVFPNDTGQQMVVRDMVFWAKRIEGPAIVAPTGRSKIEYCHIYGDPDDYLIDTDRDTAWIGVIGLVDVVFEGCEFHGVSFVGKPSFIERLRESITWVEP